jgi:hypothetical protein
MLIVDAHVHFHTCFDRDTFLNTAVERFARVAAGSDALGYLMLTESRGANAFAAWRDDGRRHGDWWFEPTEEPATLLACQSGGMRLAVVAGRQIATRGGLEVLALGTLAQVPDGLVFEEAVEAALADAPLVVLPWGFGKWWGDRGAIVKHVVDRYRGRLYLGDNGGRPSLMPEPRLFAHAAELGVGVLPGSDPLPFPNHARSVGRAGFLLDAVPDLARPLDAMLGALRAQPRAFGDGERLAAFVRDQVRMQVVKAQRQRKTATE